MLTLLRDVCIITNVPIRRSGGMADALDSKSSGAIRAGSSPASGIRIKDLTEKSVRSLLYNTKKSRKE